MDSDLSDEVRSFLRDSIRTYEDLESLLLLYEHQARDWTADSVADALRIDEPSALNTLQHLQTEGLLSHTSSRFRFDPRDDALRRRVATLAEAYERTRVLVVRTMNSNALDRLRLSAVHTFAEAFRLREKRGK